MIPVGGGCPADLQVWCRGGAVRLVCWSHLSCLRCRLQPMRWVTVGSRQQSVGPLCSAVPMSCESVITLKLKVKKKRDCQVIAHWDFSWGSVRILSIPSLINRRVCWVNGWPAEGLLGVWPAARLWQWRAAGRAGSYGSRLGVWGLMASEGRTGPGSVGWSAGTVSGQCGRE